MTQPSPVHGVPTMGQRPVHRWCHSSTGLAEFAIVTWVVDPDRLNALLPNRLVADVHGGRAFVSMVAFIDDRFHFRFAPFVRLSCGQINYRAYVRDTVTGETGVWFFTTSLDSRLAMFPRIAWHMPWHRASIRIDASWDQAGWCESWRLRAGGEQSEAKIDIVGTHTPVLPCPGFANDADQRRVLINPPTGWYERTKRRGVGRYSVWHDDLELQAAHARSARCAVYERLGLITEGQLPDHIGIQRHTTFDVHTPPFRVE